MLEENKIVDQAQQVMGNLSQKGHMVTTSQIRKFLTAVNTVTEKVNAYKLEKTDDYDTLPVELQAQNQVSESKVSLSDWTE